MRKLFLALCFLYSSNALAQSNYNYYTQYTGDINQIPLYSHQVIWILIGSGNPTGSSLPNVNFWSGEDW